jgi:hypothetical protein
MESWLDANPTRRKTPKGIKKFINSWLKKAQNQGGSPMVKSYRKADSLRSKTIEMQMGDVSWLQGEELEMMKAYYLRVIGYYYDGDLKNAQGVIS